MPIINTVFLFFAGQGIFLSFLLYQQKKIKANPWISFYFLGFSLILCYWVIASNEAISWQWRAVEFANPIQFLLGPFLFLSVTEKQRMKEPYIHFVPALASLLVLGPVWVILLSGLEMPSFYADNYVTFRTTFHVASLLSMVAYGFFTWSKKQTKERLMLVSALLIFGIGYSLYELLTYLGTMTQWLDYVMSLAMMTSFYAAGYYYLIKYKPYSSKLIVDKHNYVYLIEQVESHFQEKEVFLNPEYTLENLANELSESALKLSQAIGALGATNFKEYLNQYRIGHAKKLLLRSDDKMLVIALESGYNNTVSFSQNFKKFCEMTPGEYRVQHKSELLNV